MALFSGESLPVSVFLQRLRVCCEMFGFESGHPSYLSRWKRLFPHQHAKPSPSNVCSLLPLKTLMMEKWSLGEGGCKPVCACSFSTGAGVWVITF